MIGIKRPKERQENISDVITQPPLSWTADTRQVGSSAAGGKFLPLPSVCLIRNRDSSEQVTLSNRDDSCDDGEWNPMWSSAVVALTFDELW